MRTEMLCVHLTDDNNNTISGNQDAPNTDYRTYMLFFQNVCCFLLPKTWLLPSGILLCVNTGCETDDDPGACFVLLTFSALSIPDCCL